MKTRAALIFIPLFFVFGYWHTYGYTFPYFSFLGSVTPTVSAHTSNASSSTSGSAGNAGLSLDPAFFGASGSSQGQTSSKSSSTQSNRNISTNTKRSSQSLDKLGYAPKNSSSNIIANTANSNVSPAPTPGIPNTGVNNSPASALATSATPTPQAAPPPFISFPPLFGTQQNSARLSIFPQPSPSPISPPAVSLPSTPSTIALQVAHTESGSSPVNPPPPVSSPHPAPPSTAPTTSGNAATTSTTTPTGENAAVSSSSASTSQNTNQTISSSSTTTPPPATPPPTPPSSQSTSSATSNDTSTSASNSSTDVFSTGGVTFRFDDGWQSQYTVALPALQSAGIKGTFYIVTRQLLDQGYTGFMSSNEVKTLASDGEDIGDHTQTHPHLPDLSASDQKKEILGAKQDLEAMGIEPKTFSFPFGEYTPTTLSIVKSIGFDGSVTTIESAATKNSDRYQIESPSLVVSETPAQVEKMIQNAVDKHEWLIITFHRIDTSGDQYSMTPANFRAIVDYVKSHRIPTVTVSEGAAALTK